jgi:nucleotide-binding universal stress UspA family protein
MQSSIRSIVVPIDGSSFAERAIPTAKLLARLLGVCVGVVRFVGAADRGDTADDSYLETIAAQRQLEWFYAAEYDDVAAGIVAVTEEHDGLICMSTHGHGRSKAIMGSQAEETLRRSSAGVVLVGRNYQRNSLQHLHSLVVAVDGTIESETVCAEAARWAVRLSIPLRFVTVAEGVDGAPRIVHPFRHRFGSRENAGLYIDELVSRFQRPGLGVYGNVLFDPISPACGLGDFLTDNLDSLLVISARLRTGMQRFLHGSNAGDIIDSSPVAVVVFTSPLEESTAQL